MSPHYPNLDQPVDPTDSAEARMRLALGLGTRPANSGQPASTSSPPPASHDTVRQRRRFAQDGDVPVVILHRGRDSESGGENKLAALTADLREERAIRLKTERALDEANVTISSLMTKLKHAEMSLEEKEGKLRGESEARAQTEALLATEREARQQAETRSAEAALALSTLERKIEAATKPLPHQVVTVQPSVAQPAAAKSSAAKSPLVTSPAAKSQVVSSPSVGTPLAKSPREAKPAPDLFGGFDASALPTAPKRRMTKKTQPQPEQTAVAAAPKTEPADDEEDKPIEWWLPSFRAARKAPIRRKRAAS